MNHILIEGFIGCGKGAVGEKLSEEMNLPLIDTDLKVAEKMHMSAEEIYDRFGEVYFRALETYVLGKLLRLRKRSIIVLGSGLPTMPQNAEYLKSLGRVYYLKATEESIKKNIEKNREKAWLEDDDDLNEKVRSLMSERDPYYSSVADVVIKTGRKTTATIATEILNDVVYEAAPEEVKKAKKAEKAEKTAEEAKPAGKTKEASETPAKKKKEASGTPAKKAKETSETAAKKTKETSKAPAKRGRKKAVKSDDADK